MSGVTFAAAWFSLALSAGAPVLSVTHRARSVQPGEVVLLTISAQSAIDNVHATVFDREWPVYPDTPRRWKAIVGIDLDVAPGAYSIAIEASSEKGPLSATHKLTVTPKRFRTRTLSVDEAFVNPPESAVERIEQESRELEAIYAQTMPKQWSGAFVRPVPHAANSAFGSRSIFNGERRNPHAGADFRSPAGTPVKAPGSGQVVLARDLYFSGNTVIIDHGLGLFSLLAHLEAIDVQTGDAVHAGRVVGRVGATGRVTGPHLHWGVRLNGARVDPLSLLFVLGQSR